MFKNYSFEKKLNDLPSTIPIFPLRNCLLLPKSNLPLNLFENRYLHMFDYALLKDRLIGMIQPKEELTKQHEQPEIHSIGCVGQIIAFNQTNDNRYEIVLKGICRFSIRKELELVNGFRTASVKWESFKNDLKEYKTSLSGKRLKFEEKLKLYLKKINIKADWQAIEASSDEDLLNSISMGCPFSSIEKQALLEALSIEDRLDVLISLLDMSISENKSFQSKSLS
ncbi:MAG: peptidase S16 [Rickettsiales bacterium]|nr:peptidase S16 [Rickettsiales bacterium]OUV54813.1 MAG: hypothetical protein CBC87_00535 [Rickettsiales bacterium TMED127]|tara:strand:- start:20621 stop:21295 length:675 start_codon:yes stop_codon:yes gene_type:complete